MRLTQVFELCSSKDRVLEYLRERGVLLSGAVCPRCGGNMTFANEKGAFRCRKRSIERNEQGCNISVKCDKQVSYYHRSWFSGIHISIEDGMRFIGLYLMLNPPRQQFLQFELGFCAQTVVDWSNHVREIMIDWCEEHSTMIGGPQQVVEIDETKVGHRKYNRGRVVEGRWIFGAYERGSKRLLITVVPDRSKETLISVIREWIRPGTTIISDMWRAYSGLDQEGYEHLRVNHSLNFVDPGTGAHTQNIERSWRDLKGNLQKYGVAEEHFHGYLCEFLFKRAIPFENRLSEFFRTVAAHYNPNKGNNEAAIVTETVGGGPPEQAPET